MKRLVAVERLKLRSLGAPGAALTAAALLILLATLNAIDSTDVDPGEPVLRGPGYRVLGVESASATSAAVEDAREVLSTWSLGLLVAFAVGVAASAVERRHGTLASSLLAVPRRHELVLAKTLAVTTLAIRIGIVAFLVDLVVGGTWLHQHDASTGLSTGAVALSAAVGLCAFVLAAALGVGLGFFVSAPATGIVFGVGVLLAIEPVVASRSEQVAAYLPFHAADAVFGPLGSLVTTDVLSRPAGLLVFSAWAALCLLAAVWRLKAADAG